ncbi:hypothetical protein wHmb_10810 [Wolbachia pipientis]|nr:hypothetical protein wHmb_10810 [Wolbachia pipientis]
MVSKIATEAGTNVVNNVMSLKGKHQAIMHVKKYVITTNNVQLIVVKFMHTPINSFSALLIFIHKLSIKYFFWDE